MAKETAAVKSRYKLSDDDGTDKGWLGPSAPNTEACSLLLFLKRHCGFNTFRQNFISVYRMQTSRVRVRIEWIALTCNISTKNKKKKKKKRKKKKLTNRSEVVYRKVCVDGPIGYQPGHCGPGVRGGKNGRRRSVEAIRSSLLNLLMRPVVPLSLFLFLWSKTSCIYTSKSVLYTSSVRLCVCRDRCTHTHIHLYISIWTRCQVFTVDNRLDVSA